MVRDHGSSGSRCPSAPRGRARTDRAGAGSSGPARPAGRGFAAAAPGMRWVGGIAHGPARRGFAHLAVVVDCSPGRGRRARDRRSHARRARRRGLGHGRTGPVHRSVVSGSFTRVGGLDARGPDARGSWPAAGFSRPSGGPVAAINAVLRKELVNRGVRSARDHAIRETARTESRCDHKRLHSAIDHRTPRPSRHRMETTTQDSSPKPTINHYLKNPHHSTLLGQDVRRDRDPQRGSG